MCVYVRKRRKENCNIAGNVFRRKIETSRRIVSTLWLAEDRRAKPERFYRLEFSSYDSPAVATLISLAAVSSFAEYPCIVRENRIGQPKLMGTLFVNSSGRVEFDDANTDICSGYQARVDKQLEDLLKFANN